MEKRVLGSVAATVSGWLVGWAAYFVFCCYDEGSFVHPDWSLIRGTMGMLPIMGMVIVPTWAVVLLPIYLLVPRSHFFWNSFVCVPFGALVGFLVVQGSRAFYAIVVAHTHDYGFFIFWPLSAPGAVVGGITGLVATLTYRFFNTPRCRTS